MGESDALSAFRGERNLAFGLIVRAVRRLGDRNRVGTGKGLLQPHVQRLVELLLAVGVQFPAMLGVIAQIAIEFVMVGSERSISVHYRRFPIMAARRGANVRLPWQ